MNFQKTYVVNLDEDKDKLKFFSEQISKTNIKNRYTRFPAISGKNLDINAIDDNIITTYARNNIISKKQKMYGISLTYGSLGCALSHKKIWEECVSATGSFLIFEDDIIPHNNFDKIFNSVCERLITLNYDLFYLGYNEIPGFKKSKLDDVISKPSGLITGTYGYIVSPKGAKKLLSIFPLNKQIDSSISNNIDKFNIYCSTIKLVSASSKFGSKTQRADSCKNNIQNNNINEEWNKLFQ
jgi:GR25 family glycosyltransferase involved in LPS biosynthesis